MGWAVVAVLERPARALRPFYGFVHVYADGAWQRPLGELLGALAYNGLYERLAGLYFGIVGSVENRAKVRAVIPGEVVAEADTGWEQVTLSALHSFSENRDGLVFYAHTKGAWSDSRLAHTWRHSMIADTLLRWREIAQHMPPAEAAGPFWLKSSEPEHREHKYFFAGNFWWAQLSYVRELPAVKTEHRFQAEGWVGLNDPEVYCTREGLSFWGNFAGPLPFDAVEI